MTTLRLAMLFAKRKKIGDFRLAITLPIAAFAVVVAMLEIVLGGSRALVALGGELAGDYQALAVVALALLVVPMFTLGSTAAKLSARRRDARLSSLVLLGATRAQVSALTVIESAASALAGAMLGTVIYAALTPLVGLVSMGGARLSSALWLPWWWFPLVWLAIAFVAAASALIGLHNVHVTPLGVRTQQVVRAPGKTRLLIAVVLLVSGALSIVSWATIGELGGRLGMTIALFVGFGCATLALDAIGPAYLTLRARISLARADDVERMLAARTILHDPLAAWRNVSGLALATFIAVIAAAGLGLVDLVNVNQAAENAAEATLFADMRTGVYLTLTIAFVMVAATVAISQLVSTLDRARVHVAMDYLGVPSDLVVRASRRAVMSAVTGVMVGAGLLAVMLMLPMVGVTLIARPVALFAMVAALALGLLLVRAAASASSRLVPGILARPDRVL
jgi:hypothetical protein